jgi:hypothetical protein
MFGKSLYINTQCFVLSDLIPILQPFIYGNQQILHFFVVNLEHRNIDLILFIFILVGRNPLKNFLARNGHDTLIGSITNHRVRLSGTCLTISEETTMIALPCIR